jgi:hypothetical protein
MRHEHLARLMQAQREAMAADPVAHTTHETIMSIFSALDKGELTAGQAQRILDHQAMRMADTAAHAEFYRQAAASIRQMQREERLESQR